MYTHTHAHTVYACTLLLSLSHAHLSLSLSHTHTPKTHHTPTTTTTTTTLIPLSLSPSNTHTHKKHPQAYERQFVSYIKNGISGDDYEEVLEKVHAAIREDPTPAPKTEWSGDKTKYARVRTYIHTHT
jgi:hypothetical protein